MAIVAISVVLVSSLIGVVGYHSVSFYKTLLTISVLEHAYGLYKILKSAYKIF